MMKIYLNKLIFTGYHGLYAEEKKLPNEFEVNICIDCTASDKAIAHISQTIDYVAVYSLCKRIMAKPTDLLETLVQDIAAQILAQFSLAAAVEVHIQKLYPPVANFRGSVGVSYYAKK